MESVKKPSLDGSRNLSFNYPSTSPHSLENCKDLQKGISLLKKSVANITAYYYNWLGLDLPSEASTFEAFGKLLATLSSSKEVQSAFSLKMDSSRYTLLSAFLFQFTMPCVYILQIILIPKTNDDCLATVK